MINLAVINLKDIGKFLLKLAIVILLLWFFSRFLQNTNLKSITKDLKIDTIKLLSCIESEIPGIKDLKDKDDKNFFNNINPLKDILQMQLGIIKNTKKDNNENNTINNNEDNSILNVEIEKAKVGLKTEVIENDVPNNFSNSYGSVELKNDTEIEITEDMLNPDIIEVNNKDILIFHTHTCESYTPTEQYNYEETGTYRTTDLNYSVARVGTELENQLKAYNYNVIHDTTYHDYPSYSGSYGRSLDTVRDIIANNGDIDIIFDIHRDAIADYSYAPTVKIGEEYAAQLMFVIGTDGGGLEHPNWQQNLKFAVKLQEKANELYPGLFRPILLRNSRYNQHLGKAASIIEVGATGNTLEQCLTSMKYLAKVINETIK